MRGARSLLWDVTPMSGLRFIPRRVAVVLGVFLAACASAGPLPVAPQPGPSADARLSPGDAFRITVWRHPEFSGDFMVSVDSTLLHPIYQTVRVAGVPVGVATERLRHLLVTYDQNVQMTVEPLFAVLIVGEVHMPSLYRLPQGTTVAQALALAGGPTDLANMHDVRILRGQSRMTLDFTLDDTRRGNGTIASGDQLVVPRRSTFNWINNVVVPVTALTTAITSFVILKRLGPP